MLINYPVRDHTISQKFGRDASADPVYRKFYDLFDYKHCGVDFPVEIGTKVLASFPGVVVRKENHSGMGNVIGIRNGNIVALYAHLSNVSVDLGDIVKNGDSIGLSGRTGESCPTPHLHFELRDITKSPLKNMVFAPPFGKESAYFRDTFEYVVNNKNTQKTLKTLSKLYFGTEEKWENIKEVNNLNYDRDFPLANGLKLIIPNY